VMRIENASKQQLGATPDAWRRPRGLIAEAQSLGWVVLAEKVGREIVVLSPSRGSRTVTSPTVFLLRAARMGVGRCEDLPWNGKFSRHNSVTRATDAPISSEHRGTRPVPT
jgi:hypothetical protein